ncbi:MAG: hypothetical protein J6331_05245, partial [Lentisphaeria bacterium]|nr:hypothetical protein [Lentisphaeria bacterium]
FFPRLETDLPRGRLAVKLKNKALAPLRNGDFRIYEDSVEKLSASGSAGDVAVLFDRKQKFAGAGLFDPFSPVRVNVLSTSSSLPEVGSEHFSRLSMKRFPAERKVLPPAERRPTPSGWSTGSPTVSPDWWRTGTTRRLS